MVAEREKLAALDAPAGVEGTARRPLEHAVDAAFLKSFRVVMLIAAALALLSSLAAGFLIRPEEITDNEITDHEQ